MTVPTLLGLYNDALVYLGERKLATTSDNVDVRKSLDAVYTKEVDWCLVQAFPNWAVRAVSITASVSITSAFGYDNAFDKPSDYLRTVQFSDNETFIPPLLTVTDEGGVWYANCTPLYIKYISNDSTYGTDYNLWPIEFQDFVAVRLAWRITPRTTQNEARLKMLDDLLERAKKKFVGIDSMNNPPDFPPTGSWVNSRGRGRRVRSTSTGMIF